MTAQKPLYHGAEFRHDGCTFRVRYEQDTSSGYPWENEDGHGPVRKTGIAHRVQNGKRPGERPLNDAGRNEWQFYYDWQGAIKQAHVECWGLTEEAKTELAAKLGHIPSRREIVAEAVRRNFEFLRYCINDDCPYVGVIVELIGKDGETVAEESLWSVETFDDYHMTVAYELAEGLIYNRRQQWRKALAEARERRYWMARDVETVGTASPYL